MKRLRMEGMAPQGVVAFRRRVVIAYAVDGQDVTTLGFYYGGQRFGDLPEDGEPIS